MARIPKLVSSPLISTLLSHLQLEHKREHLPLILQLTNFKLITFGLEITQSFSLNMTSSISTKDGTMFMQRLLINFLTMK